MFAIRNKKTNKWVWGTDYRYDPPHQRTDIDKALTFNSEESAKDALLNRRCGKEYEVVEVEIKIKDE